MITSDDEHDGSNGDDFNGDGYDYGFWYFPSWREYLGLITWDYC